MGNACTGGRPGWTHGRVVPARSLMRSDNLLRKCVRQSARATASPLSTMHLLFICSKTRLRSPTAETVFSMLEGIEAVGAGLNRDADTPVSGDLVEWADAIFVMERKHKTVLAQR